MHSFSRLLVALLPLAIATPIAPIARAVEGNLLIADTGLGHRSTPIGRWPTSIRRVDTSGSNATTLQTFGYTYVSEPIIAYSFTYDPSSRHLFTATSVGVFRTEIDGSNPVTITNETFASMTYSSGRLYLGNFNEGLIKRVDIDGKNMEVFRNVSQGLLRYPSLPNYTPARSYANGLAVDELNGYIYWSAKDNNATTGGSSLRRAPLVPTNATDDTDVEVIVQGLLNPGQIRLVKDASLIYFIDIGSYYGERTALLRVQAPKKGDQASFIQVLAQDIVQSEGGTRWFHGFAVDESTDRLWYSSFYDYRYPDAAIIEMDINGGQGKTINGNATEIGFPTGLEYIV